MPRKTIKEGVLCHENCRMNCSSKFNREERQSILQDFYKLDYMMMRLYDKQKKDENKQKVNFRDGIKWIRVEEFGSYLYKEGYDEMMPFRKVNILKKGGQVEDFEVERVQGKYGTITKEKKANIKEQLQFVRLEYRYYYENIVGQD